MNTGHHPNMSISGLTLGTVQLGLDYGIANKSGMPDKSQAFDILDSAINNGITSFDTAPAYGASEALLGEFFKPKEGEMIPVFITKISKHDFHDEMSQGQIAEIIQKSISQSIENLAIDVLPICLLHDPADLSSCGGRVVEGLIKMKEMGLVGHIGASIYSPSDVEKFLELDVLDVIEIPINLFDHRLLTTGLLDRLRESNKIILARSVFLQGLFFMEPDALPEGMELAKEPIEKLRALTNETGIQIGTWENNSDKWNSGYCISSNWHGKCSTARTEHKINEHSSLIS